jgi:hypothetical protein
MRGSGISGGVVINIFILKISSRSNHGSEERKRKRD